MHSDVDPALVGRLAALLSDITGTPVGLLGPDSCRDATPGWDSVANLQFMSAVEEEFGVIIPTTAALQLQSLADMARFLREAGWNAARAQPGCRGES